MLAAPFGPSAMCFLRPARGFGWHGPRLNRLTTTPRAATSSIAKPRLAHFELSVFEPRIARRTRISHGIVVRRVRTRTVRVKPTPVTARLAKQDADAETDAAFFLRASTDFITHRCIRSERMAHARQHFHEARETDPMRCPARCSEPPHPLAHPASLEKNEGEQVHLPQSVFGKAIAYTLDTISSR